MAFSNTKRNADPVPVCRALAMPTSLLLKPESSL